MSVGDAATREKALERILTYLSLAESVERYAPSQEQKSWTNVPIRYLDGADPTFADQSLSLVRGHERLFVPPEDMQWSDIASIPFDEAWILKTSHEDEDIGKTLYQVNRVRRVPLKEVRGMFSLKTGRIVEHTIADISSGKFASGREYDEQWGEKWHAVGQPYALQSNPEIHPENTKNIQAAMTFAFTNFYEWRVCLGYAGFPTLGLVTDPEGARAAFRLRDIPNGASRRAALRNWVSGHYRTKPTGDDYDGEAIKVIEHLRGATKFTWNGLMCEVRPSAYDLRRAEKLKADKRNGKAA